MNTKDQLTGCTSVRLPGLAHAYGILIRPLPASRMETCRLLAKRESPCTSCGAADSTPRSRFVVVSLTSGTPTAVLRLTAGSLVTVRLLRRSDDAMCGARRTDGEKLGEFGRRLSNQPVRSFSA